MPYVVNKTDRKIGLICNPAIFLEAGQKKPITDQQIAELMSNSVARAALEDRVFDLFDDNENRIVQNKAQHPTMTLARQRERDRELEIEQFYLWVVIKCLTRTARTVEEICAFANAYEDRWYGRANLTYDGVFDLLLMLETQGRCTTLDGGFSWSIPVVKKRRRKRRKKQRHEDESIQDYFCCGALGHEPPNTFDVQHVPNNIFLKATTNDAIQGVELLALGRPAGNIFPENHWMYDYLNF